MATWHATHVGSAAGYVISGGGDASDTLAADVQASLEGMGERGVPIAESWEREQHVETEDDLRDLMRVQAPFHFHGPPRDEVFERTVYSPDVLRHFARVGYGDFDYRPLLGRVNAPTLVVVGEHDLTTTPRAARVLHDGIAGSELVVVPDAGHMSFVENQQAYLDAVRRFLRRAAAS